MGMGEGRIRDERTYGNFLSGEKYDIMKNCS